MSWGYHLILDCANCHLDQINNRDHIYNFIKELIKNIGMTAHGEPQIEFLLPGTDNEGYSVLQMITTSNITIHFVNKDRSAYFDIFSCKEFDKDIATATIKTFFNPTLIKETFLLRDAN